MVVSKYKVNYIQTLLIFSCSRDFIVYVSGVAYSIKLNAYLMWMDTNKLSGICNLGRNWGTLYVWPPFNSTRSTTISYSYSKYPLCGQCTYNTLKISFRPTHHRLWLMAQIRCWRQLTGWWTWGGRGQSDGSGSTVLKTSPPSSFWSLSLSTIKFCLSQTTR